MHTIVSGFMLMICPHLPRLLHYQFRHWHDCINVSELILTDIGEIAWYKRNHSKGKLRALLVSRILHCIRRAIHMLEMTMESPPFSYIFLDLYSFLSFIMFEWSNWMVFYFLKLKRRDLYHSASEMALKYMDKCLTWVHYGFMISQQKTKAHKTFYILLEYAVDQTNGEPH